MTTPTRARAIAWLSAWLVACTGAASPSSDDTSGDEACQARAEADRLTDALASCREAQAGEPPWEAQEEYDAVFDRVRTHLSSVSDPREVTSEEVQPVADAIWAFLDALTFTAQTEALRTRAEEAAEGLLRERGEDQSGPAAQAAFEAVTSIRATLHPPGVDPCAELETSATDARTHAQQVCAR
jgi:hypothetical protein